MVSPVKVKEVKLKCNSASIYTSRIVDSQELAKVAHLLLNQHSEAKTEHD